MNFAGSGRIAVTVNRYFQSAGVSPGCAATTRAATPAAYPAANEGEGRLWETRQSPSSKNVVGTA